MSRPRTSLKMRLGPDPRPTNPLAAPRRGLARLDPASQHRHPSAPQFGDHVILICDGGYQSSLTAATLQQLGFARAADVVLWLLPPCSTTRPRPPPQPPRPPGDEAGAAPPAPGRSRRHTCRHTKPGGRTNGPWPDNVAGWRGQPRVSRTGPGQAPGFGDDAPCAVRLAPHHGGTQPTELKEPAAAEPACACDKWLRQAGRTSLPD